LPRAPNRDPSNPDPDRQGVTQTLAKKRSMSRVRDFFSGRFGPSSSQASSQAPGTTVGPSGGGPVPAHIGLSNRLGAVEGVSSQGGMAPLLAIQQKHPATRSDAHIEKTTEPLKGYGAIPDVKLDHFHVEKGLPGQPIAIGSKGFGPCVALCARALTAAGEPVVGLAHVSSLADPDRALKAMNDAMVAKGAVNIEFHLVGGALVRNERGNYLRHVDRLLDAAAAQGLNVTSAKLGTAESDPADHDDADEAPLPSFGLPLAISTVVTSEKVLYCDEGPRNRILGGNRQLYAASFDMENGTKLDLNF
jgi:hypothetical protein